MDRNGVYRPVDRLDGIQAARGIAALLVAMVHQSSMIGRDPYFQFELPFSGFFEFAGSGVDLFFVISGFIISYIYCFGDKEDSRGVRGYFLKRLIRIYPSYWAALFLAVPMNYIYSGDNGMDFFDLLSSALLIPYGNNMIYSPAWTLRHEIIFYIIFSFLFFNRNFALLVIFGWISFIVFFGFGERLPVVFFDILASPWNLEFLAGILAWCLSRKIGLLSSRILLSAGIVLFSAAAAVDFIHGPIEMPWRLPAYLVASFLIVSALGARSSANFPLRVPGALLVLGDASYSLYLTHPFFQVAVNKVVKMLHLPLGGEILFALGMIAAVAGGIVFYWLVEKPLLTSCRRWVLG